MTALPPPLAAELRALRERAYGPAADIDSDAAALTRLRALERVADAPATNAPAPNATTKDAIADDATAEDTPAQETNEPLRPRADSDPWWRRRVVWAASLAVVATVTGGAAIVAATASRPDATMTVVDEASRQFFPESLEWLTSLLGMQRDRLEPYEGLGQAVVWAGESKDGVSCLLVTADHRPFGYGCARADQRPTADVVVDHGMAANATGLPERSTLRFVYRGDRIDVWITEPPTTDEVPNDSQ